MKLATNLVPKTQDRPTLVALHNVLDITHTVNYAPKSHLKISQIWFSTRYAGPAGMFLIFLQDIDKFRVSRSFLNLSKFCKVYEIESKSSR